METIRDLLKSSSPGLNTDKNLLSGDQKEFSQLCLARESPCLWPTLDFITKIRNCRSVRSFLLQFQWDLEEAVGTAALCSPCPARMELVITDWPHLSVT